MKTLLLILLSVTASAQVLYSTKASQEIMDSVMKEKPIVKLDSVARQLPNTSTTLELVTPQYTYDYVYTVTYKKFVLTIIQSEFSDIYDLRAKSNGKALILHPYTDYAIREFFNLPKRKKR